MDVRQPGFASPSTRSGPARPAHPVLKELALDVSVASLARRADATQLDVLTQMLANAEYWLSFDVAAFEPLLAKSPTPLRELGVAVALRFGDSIDSGLSVADLVRARELVLPGLPEDLKKSVGRGLEVLERAVRARDHLGALEAAGYRRYHFAQSLSVHALRAMGRSNIAIAGHKDDEKRTEVRCGEPILVTATDERARPLPAPEIESSVDAPLHTKDERDHPNQRSIFLWVPGEYHLRVPGRAAGDRKLVAL